MSTSLTTKEILVKAKSASRFVSMLDTRAKNSALEAMADSIDAHTKDILEANCEDMEVAKAKLSSSMLDRLRLDEGRVRAMADGIRVLVSLDDPIGKVLESHTRADGLLIEKTSVPMGVVGIIYESRPNVTSDAAALALKSGNACVLRTGKDAFCSALAITEAMREGLRSVGIPEDAINLVQDTSHDSANEMMRAVGLIDLLIPRGGARLIKSCVENALVPCIQTGTGICHIYVEKTADIDMALNIVENAKTSRPSVCNAEEVLLVDREIAEAFLPLLRKRLVDERVSRGLCPVELRLDSEASKIIDGTPASSEDFDTEFLDYILACAIVSDVREAAEHISCHSTGHSEAIVTRDDAAARFFTTAVDSAAVYVNASTRFTDGGEFGLGCEMGISTQKLHARGPMGLRELTTYKYIVHGNGNIR